MNEAYLKGRLVLALRKAMPGAVVFRHEDKFRGGVPDISVTWNCRTAWAEVKYDRTGSRSRVTPLQALYLRRLGGLRVTYVSLMDGAQGAFVDDDGRGACLLTLQGGRFSEYHTQVAHLVRSKILGQIADKSPD